MRDDRDIDDRADDAYDTWRQRLLDARIAGREAGRMGLSAELNPYLAIDAEYTHWHDGRMEAIAEQLKRKAA